MKLASLRAGRGVPVVELGDAMGLAAFVGEGDPFWGAFVSALHDSFAEAGRTGVHAPLVKAEEESIEVGGPQFESFLEPLLVTHALSRDDYAAIWFGAGSVEAWLRAGSRLMGGPELTREIATIGEAIRNRGASAPAPRSVRDWAYRLLAEATADVDRLKAASAGSAELEARLLTLRAEAAEAGGDLEAGLMSWVRERQDAETRLLLYRDREQELRRRMAELDEQGQEAECGACSKPLGEDFDAVRAGLAEEWEGVVQDGRWWRRRRDQLEFKPDELKDVEARALELGAAIDDMAEEIERRKVELRELEVATVRHDHLRELVGKLDESVDGEASSDDLGPLAAPGDAIEQLQEARDQLEAANMERLRSRIHGKLVSLTGGRLVGSFPTLFEDWAKGGRRGGGEVSVLELATRITLAELAADAGLSLGSVLLPTNLDRLNHADLPRALADLSRLTRRVPLVLVRATEGVVSAVPERFDLIYRVDTSGASPRVRRQRSGLGTLWLQSGLEQADVAN